MDAQSGAPIKVLIADDHPLMIAGVRRVLERSDNIEIAGEAHSGPELIRLVERRRPQVVLTDLRMPGANGTEYIEEIRTVSGGPNRCPLGVRRPPVDRRSAECRRQRVRHQEHQRY